MSDEPERREPEPERPKLTPERIKQLLEDAIPGARELRLRLERICSRNPVDFW